MSGFGAKRTRKDPTCLKIVQTDAPCRDVMITNTSYRPPLSSPIVFIA
jgi:hypothetical protein